MYGQGSEEQRKAEGACGMGVPVQMMTRQEYGGRFPGSEPEDGADPPYESGPDAVEAPARSEERDASFAGLADRQGRFMFRVAYGLLRSPQDAEDAVQETLLKLYRGEAWRAMQDEKAFLARTVWRVALDHIARRPRAAEDVAEEELASPGNSPERSAVDEGERTLLHRLIERLPEELRQPLVLSAIEEMTSREVAEVLGIPEGTVRTRLMRARTELKRRFEAMRATNTATKGVGR